MPFMSSESSRRICPALQERPDMLKKILFFGLFLLVCLGGMGWYLYPSQPLVSVVMPTYNRADLLPRSIESILNQTYDHFEFIIVDDGSTDNSAALIHAYQAQDPRIIYLKNEKNQGISFSRNRGTDAARGKYVAIMDSDDYSEPERLAKSVAFLEKYPEMTVVNTIYYEMGREANGTNNWVPPKRLEIIFNFKNFFTNIAVFRTDFVRQHNIRYNEKLMSSEDYDFWKQIVLNGGKLGMINEPLIWLRRHTSNSREYYQQIIENRKKTSAELLARFDITPLEAETKSRCELMGKMLRANRQKQIVDQYVLQLTYGNECGKEKLPSGTLYVKHMDYVDYFIPSENNIYIRMKTQEPLELISQEGLIYTFKGADGRIEIFNRQTDNALALKETRQNRESIWFNLKQKIVSFF